MTRDVLERPYTVAGGGGTPPWTPLPPPPPPMFGADSQNFASAPSVPRGFKLKTFGPPSAGTIGGPWEEGGPSQISLLPPPLPPSPPPPSNDFGDISCDYTLCTALRVEANALSVTAPGP